MKKVLIIGHFWPYHLGGSKRVFGLAKYLPEFDWEPIILTGFLKKRPDFKIKTIETNSYNTIVRLKKILGLNPQKGFQKQIGIPSEIREKEHSLTTKIMKLIEGIITYPDVEKDWKPFALKAAKEFLKTEKINALISVSPVPAHFIARELKKQYKIPWIADFPDLWSYNVSYQYGPLRKLLDIELEKRTIKLADFLTTSCLPQQKILERLHRKKLIQTIMLGYDPESVNDPPKELTKKFTITYTGLWQGQQRDPEKLFMVLRELISEELISPKDIEVRFYGPPQEWIERKIDKYRLSNIVKQLGVVSWHDCLERQRESQLLLFLNWGGKEKAASGVFSGKLLDYLASRRPIIGVGGIGEDKVIKEIFLETKAGTYCPRPEDIRECLLKFYSEYKKKGKVDYRGNSEAINKYNNREMSRKFAKILNLFQR
ncbi:MAG: hypothetical protein WC297_02835 [Candidatus Paceibacterota bacterium]|jgi:glycosyltransferase involved in cell wall biosynthesis